MKHQRGARPIQSREILQWHLKYSHKDCTLTEYESSWRQWLQNSDNKIITGLEEFSHCDYTQGTSQTFDHFLLKHCAREIVIFPGEFQYHQCAGRHLTFNDNITENSAVIISVPFSDTGKIHNKLHDTLYKCNQINVPVCLDLAYWGISKDMELHLEEFTCVTEITSSLSKPFFTLEQHRVGVRFCRSYANDGISMTNEVGMHNSYSVGLGIHHMNRFSCDFMWKTYSDAYYKTCYNLNLQPTDTIIFGLGGDEYQEYNRGIPGNNRVCISTNLRDL